MMNHKKRHETLFIKRFMPVCRNFQNRCYQPLLLLSIILSRAGNLPASFKSLIGLFLLKPAASYSSPQGLKANSLWSVICNTHSDDASRYCVPVHSPVFSLYFSSTLTNCSLPLQSCRVKMTFMLLGLALFSVSFTTMRNDNPDLS